MKFFPKLFILYFSTSIYSYARLVHKEEMHFKGFLDVHFDVKKDFSYTVESTICFDLLDDSNEASSLGTLSYSLDRGISKLELLEAWTEINDKKIKVPKENIHKGLAAVSLEGFSDVERHTISFLEVQKGARLCYHTKQKEKPPVDGYFEAQFQPSFPFTAKGSRVQIKSEMPLHVTQHNLQSFVSFSKKEERGIFIYDSLVEQDFIDEYIFEPYSNARTNRTPFLILKSHEGIDIEPFRVWKEKIDKILNEGILNQEALDFLKSLRTQNPTAKIASQKIMTWVADHIRYMGDWRSKDGHFIPRAIKDILSSGYGDCKDFSILNIKMLQGLGFKASFSLIRRGGMALPLSLDIDQAPLSIINHAIVYLEEEGGVFIDPTNIVSYVGSLDDVIDHKSLVLGTKIQIKETPKWKDSDSKMIEICELSYSGNNLTNRCNWKIEGVAAANTLMQYFRNHVEINERLILNSYSKNYTKYQFHKIPDFWSREVKPFEIQFDIDHISYSIRTPLGRVVQLAQPFQEIMDIDIEERFTSVSLPRFRNQTKDIFKSTKVAHGIKDLNCEVKSPWFQIERKVQSNKNTLEVSTKIETLKDQITPKELASQEFKKLHLDYDRCIRSKGIVIRY